MRQYLTFQLRRSFPLFLVLIAHAAQHPVSGQQVFTNVATQMGITGLTGLGHSVGWCDIDNDGDLDTALSNQDGSGFWLYRNDGSSFTDITVQAGLGGLGASRILWGEVTGDEYSDLILDTGSSQGLFSNDGDGTFTNITSGSGLTGSPDCVADFDNDGALDILSLTASGCSILYNSGSGVFTQQAAGSGDWRCAVCLDYDGDNDQDIYLGTYGSIPNALLRNDGTVFTNVTAAAGVTWNGSTEGITAGDYNNDGHTDLYLGNYSAPGCKLFENNGDGTFTDVTAAAGVLGHNDTRTVAFTDYNNDGWLDIFASHHDFYSYSNIMWRNNGNGTFSNVGVALGLSGEWMGDYFGTAWGDYNLDGDIDLFAVGHIDKYMLFRNDQSDTVPSGYLVLELEGTSSNHDAIGASVTVVAGSMSLTREIRGGEGFHDFHSMPLEFGLYDAALVESLEIRWPSGLTETYYDVAADQYIYAIEGDSLYTGIGEWSSGTSPSDMVLDCSPNPFQHTASIRCSGQAGISVVVSLYDLTGRRVRMLFNGDLPSGGIVLSWDTRDTGGSRVPAGIYICRMDSPAGSASRIVTLLD